jgi:zinc protease
MYTVEPTQDGEREVDVRRTGDVRLVMAAWHMPALAHPDSPALDVLANLLTDVPSGRLHKALVEPSCPPVPAPATTAARPRPVQRDCRGAQGRRPGQVEATLLDQVENIAARPVTEKEVDEAKQRLANAYDLYLTDVNAVGLGLSEFVAAGDWRLLFITRDAIAKVSAADVNRVAAAYLKPSNRTLGRFIPTEKPDRAEIPATPDIAALAAAYKGKAAVAAGEAFDPTPKNIQDRTQTFTLGNGLKVSLLPKKTRGETVVLDADFHFGDEKSVAASPAPAASIAGAMLMMGSQSMSREQISQRFDALKTQASVSGSLQGANISLTTPRASWPTPSRWPPTCCATRPIRKASSNSCACRCSPASKPRARNRAPWPAWRWRGISTRGRWGTHCTSRRWTSPSPTSRHSSSTT